MGVFDDYDKFTFAASEGTSEGDSRPSRRRLGGPDGTIDVFNNPLRSVSTSSLPALQRFPVTRPDGRPVRFTALSTLSPATQDLIANMVRDETQPALVEWRCVPHESPVCAVRGPLLTASRLLFSRVCGLDARR